MRGKMVPATLNGAKCRGAGRHLKRCGPCLNENKPEKAKRQGQKDHFDPSCRKIPLSRRISQEGQIWLLTFENCPLPSFSRGSEWPFWGKFPILSPYRIRQFKTNGLIKFSRGKINNCLSKVARSHTRSSWDPSIFKGSRGYLLEGRKL